MCLVERVRLHLAATTRFGELRWLDEVDSTNRVALDAARAGTPEGLVVLANHQSAGRGRLGRRWEAPPGAALLASIVLRPTDLGPGRRHLVTSAVALAAADACRALGAPRPDLKWPNDLLVGDAKLAGILAESEGSAVVVGIGLNVASAPPGAVCLRDLGVEGVTPVEVLVALLEAAEGRLGRWDAVGDEYARACATVGRRVRVDPVVGDSIVGDAIGVDAGGRLLLRPEGGGEVLALSAADVTHLRPASPER